MFRLLQAVVFSLGPFLYCEYAIAFLPIPKRYKNRNFVFVVEKAACNLFGGFSGSRSNYGPSQEFEGAVPCDAKTLGGSLRILAVL